VNIGVAAHITAASPGGPRYDLHLTPVERAGHENGIWLCQNCAKLIDNDVRAYPATVLKAWKFEAEASAARTIGKTATPEVLPSVERARLLFVESILHIPTSLEAPLRVAFGIINYGQKDAIFRLWDRTYFFATDPSQTVFAYQQTLPEEVRVAAIPNAVWHGEMRFNFQLNQDRIQALNSGAARLFFFARGEYIDEGGDAQRLPFSAMYDGLFPGKLISPPSEVRFV
jgi:hypothetical protein